MWMGTCADGYGLCRKPRFTNAATGAYLEQESTGDKFQLKLGINRLGRGQNEDIVVPTTFASSHHATLSFTSDGKCTVTGQLDRSAGSH